MRDANWEDFRIALKLAQFGTLTKAGKELNMNHTTVLRHINQLEEALNLKLFIRHQRGYQLSEAGKILLEEVPRIDEQFTRLINQLGNIEQNTQGHLRITTLSDYSSILNPALKAFRDSFPKIRIHIIATEEVIPVESGSVHVSLRAGRQPTGPDMIVKKLMPLNMGYYASNEYIEKYGIPKHPDDYNQHLWAMPSGDKHHIPFIKSLLIHLKNEQIIYQSNHFPDLHAVVAEGMAIGPMAEHHAEKYPHIKRLPIEVDQEEEMLWFVYHKDLKNSTRIKALYAFLSKSISK